MKTEDGENNYYMPHFDMSKRGTDRAQTVQHILQDSDRSVKQDGYVELVKTIRGLFDGRDEGWMSFEKVFKHVTENAFKGAPAVVPRPFANLKTQDEVDAAWEEIHRRDRMHLAGTLDPALGRDLKGFPFIPAGGLTRVASPPLIAGNAAELGAKIVAGKRMIAEQEQAIAEREERIAEQREALAQQETSLAEQKKAIADQTKLILEQREALAEQRTLLQEQKEAIAEHKKMIVEQGKIVTELEKKVADKGEQRDDIVKIIEKSMGQDEKIAGQGEKTMMKGEEIAEQGTRVMEQRKKIEESSKKIEEPSKKIFQLKAKAAGAD